MKTPIFTVTLFLLLAASQASFIEQILNHTKFHNDFNINTTDNVKIGYKGGLRFDNGIIKLNLLNIAGNLNSAAKNLSQDGHSEGSVTYDGGINIIEEGKIAHVAVNGVAGANFSSQVNSDNATDYDTQLTNKNSWNTSFGDYLASGTHNASLQDAGHITNAGIYFNLHKLHADNSVAGQIASKNGNEIGNFSAKKVISGNVGTSILIPRNTLNKNSTETGSPLSHYILTNKFTFRNGDRWQWNNETTEEVKSGEAHIESNVWNQSKSDENRTFLGRAADTNVNYYYTGFIKKNGENFGHANVVGHVKANHGGSFTHFKNGTNVSGFNESMNFDRSREVYWKDGSIRKVFDGFVRSKGAIEAQPTLEDVTNVGLRGESEWNLHEKDSAGEDWEFDGNRTLNGGFLVKNMSEIEDINITINKDF